VHQRQQADQRGQILGRQRHHRGIPCQQRHCGLRIGAGIAPPCGQVQPRHRSALDRGGQIVQRTGPRRQAKVEHGAHGIVRRPQQIGRVPVVVRPQGRQPGQAIGQPLAQRGKPVRQIVPPGHAGQKPGQRRARGNIGLCRSQRIGRRHDRKTADQRIGAARGRVKIARSTMQPPQRDTCGMGVTMAEERRPRRPVAIKIQPRRAVVQFIGPIAPGQCTSAIMRGNDVGHRQSVRPQMRHEGMFLRQRPG
jgi:hypothetical protein